MNFNFHQKPDYNLNTGLIDELIRLYGTPVRFLVTEKLMDSYFTPNSHESAYTGNKANRVFGDFKTIKVDGYREALEFHVLLSESEEYPNGLQFAFNNFGLINDDTLQVFVSLRSLKSLEVNGEVHPKEIISNLIVFPNGKVMEITDCQLHVPGVNNKFVYSNIPSCYQLSLKSYSFDRSAVDRKHQNNERVQLNQNTLQNLDRFFDKQDQHAQYIKDFATEEQLVDNVQNPLEEKTARSKVDDVFGSFG